MTDRGTSKIGSPGTAIADVIDECVERFQAAWRPGRPAEFDDYLPADESLRLVAITALALADMELTADQSEMPRAQRYLERYPILESCASLAVVLFAREYALLRQSFPELSLAEYLEAVPENLRSELRGLVGPSRFAQTRFHAQGGQGEVWLGRDRELGRLVALKILKPALNTEDGRRRIHREACLTSRLEHPGVVPVYGLQETDDGRIGYAMRFLAWPTFREWIREFHQRLPAKQRSGATEQVTESERTVRRAMVEERNKSLRRLLRCFVDVCNTVAYAHQQGFLHLDIKPENVLVGEYGEVVVMDWGLARPLGPTGEHSRVVRSRPRDAGPTESTVVLPKQDTGDATEPLDDRPTAIAGTPAYMSPEQAAGDADRIRETSDVYLLGGLLYEILTNRPPHEIRDGEPLSLLLKRIEENQVKRPRSISREVPKALEAVCLKAIARAEDDRYASASDLAGDVESWLADAPVTAYRESVVKRVTRWIRNHKRSFTTAIVILLAGLASLAMIVRERRKATAVAQIQVLAEADAQAVPRIIRDLVRDYHWTAAALRHAAVQETDRDRRRRMRLALLPRDMTVLEGLLDELATVTDPDELLMTRDFVDQHASGAPEEVWQGAIGRLWATVSAPPSGPEQLAAASALALFEPDSPRWPDAGEAIAAELVAVDPLAAGTWIEGFRPVSHHFEVPLQGVFEDPSRRVDQRILAAAALTSYCRYRPKQLAALILNADRHQYETVFAELKKYRDDAIEFMRAVLDSKSDVPAVEDGAQTSDRVIRQKANAAVTLFRLDQEQDLWPLLRHGPDPRLRTRLIHTLPHMGIDPKKLVTRFGVEDDAGVRRALLLCLAEFSEQRLPSETQITFIQQLELIHLYRNDRDCGIHSAAEWLLRCWGYEEEVQAIKSALSGKPQSDRDWFVTPMGHTMMVLEQRPDGSFFLMGSPDNEDGYREPEAWETRHRRYIPRTFAIAAEETTVDQYQAYVQELLATEDALPLAFQFRSEFSSGGKGPVFDVSWFEAAAYCNWLSRSEGLDPCYPSWIEELAVQRDVGTETLELPADLLERSGYRLPTEAEWEFACRAGSQTRRCYGNSDQWLEHYASYRYNTKLGPSLTGCHKPNDFGLFDVHGNVMEWCISFLDYPLSSNDRVVVDAGGSQWERVLRGAGHTNAPMVVRSAYRLREPLGDDRTLHQMRSIDIGFRVARTLSVPEAAKLDGE